jgi:hypothetical protein
MSANPAAVAEALRVTVSALPAFKPRYNVCPTQQVLTAVWSGGQHRRA